MRLKAALRDLSVIEEIGPGGAPQIFAYLGEFDSRSLLLIVRPTISILAT